MKPNYLWGFDVAIQNEPMEADAVSLLNSKGFRDFHVGYADGIIVAKAMKKGRLS